MAKIKKPSLTKALKNLEKSDNELFGNVEIDITSLPCFKKKKKEKITANIDADVLEKMKKIASDHEIPYQNLMNDALREVFLNSKKKKKAS